MGRGVAFRLFIGSQAKKWQFPTGVFFVPRKKGDPPVQCAPLVPVLPVSWRRRRIKESGKWMQHVVQLACSGSTCAQIHRIIVRKLLELIELTVELIELIELIVELIELIVELMVKNELTAMN